MIRLGIHDGSEALINANWKSGFLAKTPCSMLSAETARKTRRFAQRSYSKSR